MQFKKGDKVVCIDADELNLELYKTYIIKQHSNITINTDINFNSFVFLYDLFFEI